MCASVKCIEIFSWWVGFADPPARSAKLTITPCGSYFLREQALTGSPDSLPADTVAAFLTALFRNPVPDLDQAQFKFPEPTLWAHYNSLWTDDSPSHLLRLVLTTGRQITVRAESQHACMLPLKITDSETGDETRTFDPRLSQAIAALMPDGYQDKERLAGESSFLDWATHDSSRTEAQPSERVEQSPVPESSSLRNPEGERDWFDEILRILSGEESPQEKAEAERIGHLSERLLRRNSLDEVRSLLARGANPSVADEHGQTPLMLAASPPVDRERFRLLVRAGADINGRRFDGLTGLHLACAGGMQEAAEEWVRAGADVNARTPEGTTPLMFGAKWLGVVQVLLKAGANVNAVDKDGHTALVYAILDQSWVAAEQQLDAMRALLSAGAEINHPDKEGITPLGHARRVLARTQLTEEVCRAFQPDCDPSLGMEWDDKRMAEAVCQLLAFAGGRD